MALPERQSPKGKRVSLFVTCIVDMIYPQTGMSVVYILEHLSVQVGFPPAQTCCGQPAFNSGYRDESRTVAIPPHVIGDHFKIVRETFLQSLQRR